MRGQFETVFEEAYDRTKGTSEEIELDQSRILRDPTQLARYMMDKEEFVNEVVQSILDEIPSEDEVRGKYGFETNFHDAPMSDEIAESEERASKTRRETMISEGAISEEKRKILDQMRSNVEAQTERRKKEIEATFAKVESDFYKGLYESLEHVSGYMKANGKMTGRIGMQLRKACDHVRNMNLMGDEDLNNKIDSIEHYLDDRSAAVNDDSKELAMTRLQDALESTSNYVTSRLSALPSMRGARIIDNTTEVETTNRRVIPRVEAVETIDIGDVQQVRRNVADPVGA
jgi:hypothetical protein